MKTQLNIHLGKKKFPVAFHILQKKQVQKDADGMQRSSSKVLWEKMCAVICVTAQ